MTGAEIEPPKESINTVMHTLAMMPWPPGLGFKIRMRSDLWKKTSESRAYLSIAYVYIQDGDLVSRTSIPKNMIHTRHSLLSLF